MEMVKTKGAALVLAMLLAACACMLAGCSNDAPASDSGQKAESSESRAIVGNQANSSKAIILQNGLGVDISMVGVNVSGSKDQPTVLTVAPAWKQGSDAMVFLPEANASAPSDLVLTADDEEFVLHDVDFSAFDDADVMLEGDVAYLSYELDGQTVTTLDHEKEIADKAAADKKAKAEAKKKAEEEAEAQKQAEEAEAEAESAATEEAAPQEEVYEEPAPEETYYEEPVVEEAAPEQSSDQCIEGGVVLR